MKNDILEKNRAYSNMYKQKIENSRVPTLLNKILVIECEKIKNIVDLGCGDGGVIKALEKEYPGKFKITGIDISDRRIRDLINLFPSHQFLCEDCSSTSLPDKHFDLVIATQVIEHLPDDKKFLTEVNRILKSYISSVIKKPWAIYKYWNNGKFVLDPTHVYEYKSKDEFLNLLENNNFIVLEYLIYRVKRKILNLHIPIPGFFIIEAICKKREKF